MRTFTSKTQKIGEIGEKLAKMFLVKHGFEVLESNYTVKMGEIDIVAKKGDIWHFVEVKSVTREIYTEKDDFLIFADRNPYRPEENMHPKKIERFTRSVEHYLMKNNLEVEHQIDLALVYIDQAKKMGKVKLLENIV